MSRIWEALRQAERQRSEADSPDSKNTRLRGDSDRRRDLRHSHNVLLLIYGSDAEKQPFHEEAETIDVTKDGCLLALESVVSKGQRLFLTNTRNQAEQECRVVYVGRRIRGRARVGIEFLRAAPGFWRPA